MYFKNRAQIPSEIFLYIRDIEHTKYVLTILYIVFKTFTFEQLLLPIISLLYFTV